MFAIVAAIASGAIILGLIMSIMNMGKPGDAATQGQCLPRTLDSIVVDYPIRQPGVSALPGGFNLEAVDYAGGAVIMFYADHSLCPFTESFTGEIEKGAIVITVNKLDEIKNSAQFQDEQLKYYKNHPETIAKVQPITVNGNKGIDWEPFIDTDTVRTNGNITSQKPVKMPGYATFFDDSDGTIYGIRGHQSLQELTGIGASLLA